MKTASHLFVVALILGFLLPTKIIAQDSTSIKPSMTKWKNKFTAEDKKLLVGFSVGYVAKDWSTSINGTTIHEDLWGNPNKKLKGVQFGLHFQQSIYYGVGWRAGLYYEWYISHDSFLKENGWDRFNEHCLYIPLHVQFRLPIARKICISPYAGIGFNIAMMGKMKNGPRTGASGKEIIDNGLRWRNTGFGLVDFIGNIVDYATQQPTYIQHEVQKYVYDDYTPRRFNLQAELGFAMRIYATELTFTYSWGVTRHHLYDFAPSRQNKLAVNLALVL